MLTIKELNLGYNDAENYRRRESKDIFSQLFIRTKFLDDLCKQNVYFLIGEKGTGKTAHAVYLSNTTYTQANSSAQPHISRLVYIRETEYEKFVHLKRERHLQLSDYTNIWVVIIYLLMAKHVSENEKKPNAPITNWLKFRSLEQAIDEFYQDAFSPEIINAMNFVEESNVSAELIQKYINIALGRSHTKTFTENRFQVNLLYLQNMFESAFRDLKLENNHILFIDGIDIRPSSLEYLEYLDCVKGLANAIWKINNDFFPSIRDSKGRLRVVLLMRPDIFDTIGLQNQNNKIRDNSVVLNWITTFEEYRSSAIFEMTDRLFCFQQTEDLELGQAWDYYFPFKIRNFRTRKYDDSPFVELLKISLYRPRDFISLLDLLRQQVIANGDDNKKVFTEMDIFHSTFRRDYAQYLLGEVKDQLVFYHTIDDYKVFRHFFTYLDGKISFNYEEFLRAYEKMLKSLKERIDPSPTFFETPDIFLQFLYELNVLCYYQDTQSGVRHYHWCFRDRTSTNLSPRVKTNVNYLIQFGIAKALDIGETFRS